MSVISSEIENLFIHNSRNGMSNYLSWFLSGGFMRPISAGYQSFMKHLVKGQYKGTPLIQPPTDRINGVGSDFMGGLCIVR